MPWGCLTTPGSRSLDAAENLAANGIAVDRHELNALVQEIDVVHSLKAVKQVAVLFELLEFFELFLVLLDQELALGSGEEGGHLRFVVVRSPAW